MKKSIIIITTIVLAVAMTVPCFASSLAVTMAITTTDNVGKEEILNAYKYLINKNEYYETDNKLYVTNINGFECYTTLDGEFYYGNDLLYNNVALLDQDINYRSLTQRGIEAVCYTEEYINTYVFGEIISSVSISEIVENYKICVESGNYYDDIDKLYVAYVNGKECYTTADGRFYYDNKLLYLNIATMIIAIMVTLYSRMVLWQLLLIQTLYVSTTLAKLLQ